MVTERMVSALTTSSKSVLIMKQIEGPATILIASEFSENYPGQIVLIYSR